MREEYVQYKQPLLEIVRASGDRYLLAEVLVLEYGKRFVENGEFKQGQAAYLEADQLLTEVGSSRNNMNRFYMAQLYLLLGNSEKAKSEAGLAIEYCQRVGEKFTHAFIRMFLSLVAETQASLPEAVEYMKAYLEIIKEVGIPRYIAWGYVYFGRLKYLGENRVDALAYLREGLELLKTCEKELRDLSYIFVQMGGAFVHRNPQIALRFLSFAHSLDTQPRDPIFYTSYFDRSHVAACAKLNEMESDSAWEAGSSLTTEQAIDLALDVLKEL